MADTANKKSKAKSTEKPSESPKNKKDQAANSPANKKENVASKPQDSPKTEKKSENVKKSDDAPANVAAPAESAANVVANNANNAAPAENAAPKENVANKDNKGERKEPKPKESGKGSVKAILSGDTFVIINLSKGQSGPPTELTMSLSNISAPSLGRRGGKEEEPAKDQSKEEKDEVEETEPKEGKRSAPATEQPFAWEAREFLRKLLVGQQVSYVIEATAPSKKAYGVVYLPNGDNVAEKVVAAGYATVRDTKGGSERWTELQRLFDLNSEAQSQHRGIYGKDAQSKTARKVPKNDEHTTTQLYEKLRGKPQSAVVEQVITGSTLRISLVPSHHEVVLILSGVECPMINLKKKITKPFSREAKFYTEYKVLNRDVEVFLEGADRQNLYGSVVYKDAGDRQGHLNVELLGQGLGTYVEWSGSRTGQFAEKLRAAEKDAKSKQVRVWADYSAPKGLSAQEDKKALKPGKEVLGKVTEIVTPTCIVVVDAKSMDHKIWLSSVRPKKPQARDEKGEKGEKAEKTEKGARKEEDPAAAEAKEMLRKRLIGQKVRCVFDYTQPALQPTVDDRDSYTVYLDKNNIAVELVEAGLIVTAPHKGVEARSKDYELLLFAENRAIKAQKGQHATGDRKPKNQMQDVRDVTTAKAKFPSLERAGKLRGVVDYEFSATKIKLLVPKETCKIVLVLAGVTSGTRAGQEPTKEQRELAAEALFFVKEKIHQHDVEFQVTGLDKSHTFIGDVWVNKQSLAAMLLEQGFIKTFRTEDRELTSAEEIAKRNRRRIWKDYDPEVEKRAREEKFAKNQAQRMKERQLIEIVVTEIVDGGHFYAQIVGERGNAEPTTEKTETPAAEKDATGKEQTQGRGKKAKVNYKEEISQLEELMKALSEDEVGEPHVPRGNEIVKAQFSEDDAWYRAKVLAVDKNAGEVTVQYIDYGNSEKLKMDRVRKLSEQFNVTKLRPQAYECYLSSVTVPKIDDDFGRDAAEFFKELVWGKTITANIDAREGKDVETLYVSVSTENEMHVNAAMIHNGLARVNVNRKDDSELAKTLRDEENKARREHAGIWRYGDPGDDEDEDDRPRRGGRN